MKRFRIGFAVVLSLGLIFSSLTTPPDATAADKTILIGFTASKTGKLNVEATRQINGMNLWVEQVNKAGGIKLPDGTMIKVQTKYYDDESNKDRVQELYTRLISTDKADFLISPYSSGLADAAAVIAQQYKKIMIATGASSDSTYKKGYTLVYMTYTPASRYLTGAVDLLLKLDPKAKKIAIIHENDKFSTDVVNGLKKYAEGKGMQVPLFEGYDSGTTDFAPFINKIPKGVGCGDGRRPFCRYHHLCPAALREEGPHQDDRACWWPRRSPNLRNWARPASPWSVPASGNPWPSTALKPPRRKMSSGLAPPCRNSSSSIRINTVRKSLPTTAPGATPRA